jgi:RHS repeat-associated protein
MRTNNVYQLITAAVFLLMLQNAHAQTWTPEHKVGTASATYHYSYNQVPQQLVELSPPAIPNTGLSYQWESSSLPLSGFTNIAGATQSSYSFSTPLAATMYYRRKTTLGTGSMYSNVVKISVVSINWEDVNYIRQHDILTTGITTWQAADQLAIGPKLQTTSYLDALGRPTQSVSKETATPTTANGTWGDIVAFAQYDAYGRQPVNYLPYTTTSEPGKLKINPLFEQQQYYSNKYGETSPWATITYDNSPLNRIMNVKKPGTTWATATGNSAAYEVNTVNDDVKIYTAGYTAGATPVYAGVYLPGTLYKLTTYDENNKQVTEYTNKNGQLILRKVQLDDAPANAYDGWICTYNIYDDYGLLRCQVQPEGVKWLSQNGWNITTAILNEQCFQYHYDDKGRTIWKKAPGAQPLQMLYDVRDRVVYMQDGNQAALTTPQWTANVYDELDRPIISTHYNTTKTVATLQADITNAPISNTVTITNTGAATVTAKTHLCPLTTAELTNSTTTVKLKYLFYDDYTFAAVKTFNTTNTNTTAYPTSDPNVQPIAKTQRTLSMSTGSMTRVLNQTTFLTVTAYYDERGSLIQTLEDNIKTGKDITTLQYHFDGRVLSTCSDHTVPNSGLTNFKILNKYIFDKLARVTSIEKQVGSNAFKTIATYSYDDVGRPKKKTLDPSYTAGGNSGLESLDFSYNIHNQLTGINKDYALKTPGVYSKWGHFFGMYLGFDNKDNVFAAANLNGQVSGQLWNTQGDAEQRRYDYTYDNAGRLVTADFNQKFGTVWGKTPPTGGQGMDFSVTGNSGKITYDLNGNLLNMLHKGVQPGNNTPITVDNLSYSYNVVSGVTGNKLQTVTDNMTNVTINGQFGDFKDGTNTTTPDYVYDNNGNLVIDLNKNAKDLGNVVGANGIKYNYLDKPEQIRITGKGTITIVYSADGEKLQRSFAPEPSGATVTTTYVNQYIYQESTAGGGLKLQQINFEEGRIRVITPTSQSNGLDALIVSGNMALPAYPGGGGGAGVWDYFITDHLGNVRMVLTEEIHEAQNTATMETARAALEESIFGQAGTNNEVATTRYATSNTSWTGNTSAQVSRTGTLSGRNIGPNVLQKVMAGDKVNAMVNYYHQGTAGGNSTTMVNNVLTSLVQAITGSGGTSGIVKGNTAGINSQLNGNSGFINAVQPNGSNPAGNAPQAYITAIFFDERFNMIPAAEGGVVQQQVQASVSGAGMPQLVLTPTDYKAPKNGYVYIYLSNQSNNDVYWDNFTVNIKQGQIVEENHYYAYGLKIATLSSKKLGDSYEGSLKNNYLYQGSFSELDEDIEWHDFYLRNYDAQIGRWVQQDPYQQFASPYVGMGADPINLTDPSGGSVADPLVKTLDAVVVKCVIAKVIPAAAKGMSFLSVASFTIKTALAAANIINSPSLTAQVGGNCPDCPTGWLEAEVTMETVTVTSTRSRYEDWSYKQMANAIDVGLHNGRTVEDIAQGLKEGHASKKVMEMFYEASDDASINFRRNYDELTDRQFEFEKNMVLLGLSLIPAERAVSWGGKGAKYLHKVYQKYKQARAARAAARAAAKKVDNILSQAGKLKRLKHGKRLGEIKGDGQKIFDDLIKDGTGRADGGYLLKDGTIVNKHISKETGEFTIDINRGGAQYKIRVTQ